MSKHLDIHALWEKFEQEVARETTRGTPSPAPTLDLTIHAVPPETAAANDERIEMVHGHAIRITSAVIEGIRCDVPQFIRRKAGGWVCERIRKGDPDLRFEVEDIEGSDLSYSLGITYLKLQHHLKSIPVKALSQLRLKDRKTGAQKTAISGLSFNWVLNKQRFVYEGRFMVSGLDENGKGVVKTFHVGNEATLDGLRLDRAFKEAREYREASLRRDVVINGKSLEVPTGGRRPKIGYDLDKALTLLAAQRRKDSARKARLVDEWLPTDLSTLPGFRGFRGWKMGWSAVDVGSQRLFVPAFVRRLEGQWYVFLPEKDGNGFEWLEEDRGSAGDALRRCLKQVLLHWFDVGWTAPRHRLFTAGHVDVDWFLSQAPAWFGELAGHSEAAAYFATAKVADLRWLCLPNKDLLQRRPIYYVASGDDLSAFERITKARWSAVAADPLLARQAS